MEDLDFEINFYEKLLKEHPDFEDALIALGDAYTRKGRHKEGLEIDKRLAKLKPDDPTVHYNLACSYSLLKLPDSCLEALQKAVRLGWRDFSFMEKDPDLASIRKDPRYKDLLYKYVKKKS